MEEKDKPLESASDVAETKAIPTSKTKLQNPYGGTATVFDKDGLPKTSAVAPAQTSMVGYQPGDVRPRSWVVLLALSVLLGMFGAHNFYMGFHSRGTIQWLLTVIGLVSSLVMVGFFLLALVGFWVFIEFSMILLGSGKYQTCSRGIRVQM